MFRYCVAGGLELAIMCDLRVVEENSKMGFLNRRWSFLDMLNFGPQCSISYMFVVLICVPCSRFGVPLIDGGTVRLPKLIGLSRAMDLILTGRMLDPKVLISDADVVDVSLSLWLLFSSQTAH